MILLVKRDPGEGFPGNIVARQQLIWVGSGEHGNTLILQAVQESYHLRVKKHDFSQPLHVNT
jgi:hypothetical protein